MAKRTTKSKRAKRHLKQIEFFEAMPSALPLTPPIVTEAPGSFDKQLVRLPDWPTIISYSQAIVADAARRLSRIAQALTSKPARRVYYIASVIGITALCVASLRFIDHTYSAYASDINNPAALMAKQTTGTTILDRNGVVLYQIYGATTRTSVNLNDVPKNLINATLAAEDPGFYKQPAISLRATARALYQDIIHRGAVEGGSTLTQQLVKNTMVAPNGNLLRKAQEIILASDLEARYSKDKIMEMYLNDIYYGQGSYGVGSAAQTYFKTDAKNLSLAQSAMLAGMPLGPSRFDPTQDPIVAKQRRNYVLDRMQSLNFISAAEAKTAKAEPIVAYPRQISIKAPGFVFYVLDQLRTQYGDNAIEHGGLTVTTTLDLSKQKVGEDIVTAQINKLASRHVTDGALVSLDPKTGEVLTMVGSSDYNNPVFGAINMVTSPRQPGSSIKPLIYLDAFTKGYNPATVVDDLPVSFPDGNSVYQPHDYDMKWRGKVTLTEALGNSLNVPAIHVLQYVGISDALNFMHTLGITTINNDPSSYGLSLTLGSSEVKMIDMGAAYGVFANQGKSVTPISIKQVKDRYGHDITKANTVSAKQLVDPRDVYKLTSILSDDNARKMEFGLNSPLHLSRPAAAKTGTTTDFKDNWTVGYTPDVVTVAWAGNADDSPMGDGVNGIMGAAPIWHDYMETILAGTPVNNFAQPTGMASVKVCKLDGGLANPWDSASVTVVMKNEEVPKKQCATQAPAPPPPPAADPTPVPPSPDNQPVPPPAVPPTDNKPPKPITKCIFGECQ